MNALKAVTKWLVIAAIVISVLLMILLGLGYLLNENEKNTKALVAQLEQEQQRNSKAPTPLLEPSSVANLPEQTAKQYEKQLVADLAALEQQNRINGIIVNNLVCMDVNQCRMVDTGQTTLGCVVAVNTIGKSLLSKENFGNKEAACEEQISQLSLTCHHNICSIR